MLASLNFDNSKKREKAFHDKNRKVNYIRCSNQVKFKRSKNIFKY